MKKFRMYAFSILVLFLMTGNVNATSVSTSEDLLNCLSAGGTCTLSRNIELSDRLVVTSGKTVVLDLNGKTLNLTHTRDNYAALIQGNLTIRGNGTFNISNYLGFGVTGKLTIENGTFNQTNGSYLIGNWGTTTIKNGTFNGDYCVLNVFSGTGIVENGTFNTKPYEHYFEEGEEGDGVVYYWAMLVGENASLNVKKGTFNQILSYSNNILSNDAEVTYILEDDNNLYDPVEIKGNVTIDLNGHKVLFNENEIQTGEDTVFTVLRDGKLTINDTKGTGIISAGDTGKIYSAVKLTKKGETAEGDIAELVVNGGTLEGYYYAVVGNGSRHNTKITINDGTLQTNNNDDSIGIFHPQFGELTINGGTITGVTGIEMRGGTLVVNNGTIQGIGTELKNAANGSGSTTFGAGIGVSQHTTVKAIKVTINGGTIQGMAPIYQVDPQNLGETGYMQVSVKLINGKYETINNGTRAVYSQNNRVNVTGGTYSTDVKDYVSSELVSKKVGNVYVVVAENKVNVTTATNGTVTVDKAKAVVGETIAVTVTPAEGYELSTLKVVDADNKEVTIENNKFVMPNSEVTVTAAFKKLETTVSLPVVDTEIEVEEVVVGVKESEEAKEVLLESLTEMLKDEEQKELAETLTNSSAVVEVEIAKVEEKAVEESVVEKMQEKVGKATIATYFDITVVVKNASNGSTLGAIPELTKEIELMVLLPEELKNTDKEVNRVYYVVREHNGTVDKFEAKLSEDGKSLVFKSNKFSTYALAYEDAKVVDTKVPQTFDGISMYLVLGTVSLLALLGASLYIKKRNFN